MSTILVKKSTATPARKSAVKATVPGPSSYDRQQADIGGGLAFGGIVMVVLLGLLVWQGLF